MINLSTVLVLIWYSSQKHILIIIDVPPPQDGRRFQAAIPSIEYLSIEGDG
ncbi:MAG: hypothetical protein KAG84_02970 [Bacteroidales bacterium]|nr:hypothetical protein [Bacteroidales bacterium]